ncbi:hypothetical protein ABT010_13195 [Streptomyces sp. NPDC002668]|uniref:hypothetical protein n=1 Tax=Streptomyces sp. NPDC002668 TaxID=3154422 RepID=UPI003320A69C
MYLTRNIGRWQVELHQRAIHLTRQPKADPNCNACSGRGGHGLTTEDGLGDWEDCHCLSWLRTWRLPLWPRRTNTREEYPF